MARQKKPVHRVQMTEGKRNIIHTYKTCLGSSFLCLGSTHKKKENNTDDKQFPACIVGKSEFIEFFCDLQLLVDRFTA